jgi:uncharacterized protein (DUF1778 family)
MVITMRSNIKVHAEKKHMAHRSHPLTLAGRVNERQLARVDAAARLRGTTRSEYVRETMLAQAERDLRAEVENGEREGD